MREQIDEVSEKVRNFGLLIKG